MRKITVEEMKEALKKDGRITVQGFGAFEIKETKERKGRHPKTGEEITIQPKQYVVFRMSKSFFK